MNRYRNRIRLIGKGALFLLLPYVLLVQLATVWPELHGFLHGKIGGSYCCSAHSKQSSSDDQQSSDHKCAVTLFLSGVLSWSDNLDIVFKSPDQESFPRTFASQCVCFSVSLPPVRGPPIERQSLV